MDEIKKTCKTSILSGLIYVFTIIKKHRLNEDRLSISIILKVQAPLEIDDEVRLRSV